MGLPGRLDPAITQPEIQLPGLEQDWQGDPSQRGRRGSWGQFTMEGLQDRARVRVWVGVVRAEAGGTMYHTKLFEF